MWSSYLIVQDVNSLLKEVKQDTEGYMLFSATYLYEVRL